MTAIRVYRIPELMPYVNWSYFYFAWGVKADMPEAREIRDEATRMMHHLSLNGVVVRAAFRLLAAYSEGDDVVLASSISHNPSPITPQPSPRPPQPSSVNHKSSRLSFLRQQHAREAEPCLCMADFIAPRGYEDEQQVADRIGLFATSVSASHECPCCTGDVLLLQTVKDRLAEAAAEVLHLEVRRRLWGYAPDEAAPQPGETGFDEHLAALFSERFQGIRPAVGYPSLPDQSFIFQLAEHLPFDQLGISLTENGMMLPHASTCGLMLAHPEARYFAVGNVADDQLADYARRRGLPTQYLRKFLPLP